MHNNLSPCDLIPESADVSLISGARQRRDQALGAGFASFSLMLVHPQSFASKGSKVIKECTRVDKYYYSAKNIVETIHHTPGYIKGTFLKACLWNLHNVRTVFDLVVQESRHEFPDHNEVDKSCKCPNCEAFRFRGCPPLQMLQRSDPHPLRSIPRIRPIRRRPPLQR